MSKYCITSLTTTDSYQYYIPLFIYTCKRAYPDVCVMVYIKGQMNDRVKEALGVVKNKYPDGWKVVQNAFADYPDRASTCNTLRYLLPDKKMKKFDYVISMDIDFLIFRQSPGHFQYFIKRMNDTKTVYFSTRGPYRAPKRYDINKIGWKREFTRIACGMVIFKTPEWYDKTKKAREYYQNLVKTGQADRIDNVPSCTYRECDEVYLYRICKKSGLPTPKIKSKGVDGKGVSSYYRCIHVGDFNKKKSFRYEWIAKKVKVENIRAFVEMDTTDQVWKSVYEKVAVNKRIRRMIRRIRKHADRRL